VIPDTTRTRQNDNVFATATSTFDYGGHGALGSPLSVSTTNTRHNNASWYGGSLDQWIGNAASTTWSTTSYSYAWYQGAVQTGITMQEGNATRTTSFTLSTVAGNAITTSVYIGDGRARTVNFTTDLSGQVIKRTEQDGDPAPRSGRFIQSVYSPFEVPHIFGPATGGVADGACKVAKLLDVGELGVEPALEFVEDRPCLMLSGFAPDVGSLGHWGYTLKGLAKL
jgi:hypothetical protein